MFESINAVVIIGIYHIMHVPLLTVVSRVIAYYFFKCRVGSEMKHSRIKFYYIFYFKIKNMF